MQDAACRSVVDSLPARPPGGVRAARPCSIDAHQQVRGAGDLSNRKDQPGRRVIDGGADDPNRIDGAPTVYR